MSGRHDGKSSSLSFLWPQKLGQHVNMVGAPADYISSIQYSNHRKSFAKYKLYVQVASQRILALGLAYFVLPAD